MGAYHIYKNHMGGNLVHKLKKLKFDVIGELTCCKAYIQISWADFPVRISNVNDKCLVYYWHRHLHSTIFFMLTSFDIFLKGGKVLARYEISAREFLYPTPTLTGKDGVERELLLSRTVHFTVSWKVTTAVLFNRLKTWDRMVFPLIYISYYVPIRRLANF